MDWKTLIELAVPLLSDPISAVIVGFFGLVFLHKDISKRLSGLGEGDASAWLTLIVIWFGWALLSKALSSIFSLTSEWYRQSVQATVDRFAFIGKHFEAHPVAYSVILVILMLTAVLAWFLRGREVFRKFASETDWDIDWLLPYLWVFVFLAALQVAAALLYVSEHLLGMEAPK